MQTPIIDSSLTLEEALSNKEFPKEIRNILTLIDVDYISFDNRVHRGQIVIHKELANDVLEIFKELLKQKFPIAFVIPVVKYDWDDDASMEANNTSGFNYRLIYGTNQVSNHAYGRAIDINPVQNPYVRIDGSTAPAQASHDLSKPGTIPVDIAELFLKRGWKWGGNWEQKDWQHFEKV